MVPIDGKDTVYHFKNTNGLRNSWVKSFAQSPLTGEVFVGTSEGIYYVTNYVNFPLEIKFNKIENSKGQVEYWTSHRDKYPSNDIDSDIATLERNEVSITPISPDFLYGDSSNSLHNWLKEVFNK